MKKKTLALASAATLAAVLLSAPAGATPIDYNGAKFDVLVTGSSGTSYNFRFTADFTSAAWQTYRAANNNLYVDSVGFGIAGYDVFTPPNVALNGTNAPGIWAPGVGTINSSGCAFASNGQGPCANAGSATSAATLGTYYWDFTASFYKNGSCGTGNKPACAGQSIPDSAFLQSGNPVRADFYSTGIASLAGPFTICRNGNCGGGGDNPVPEPGSLALLGLGLLGLSLMRSRHTVISGHATN